MEPIRVNAVDEIRNSSGLVERANRIRVRVGGEETVVWDNLPKRIAVDAERPRVDELIFDLKDSGDNDNLVEQSRQIVASIKNAQG